MSTTRRTRRLRADTLVRFLLACAATFCLAQGLPEPPAEVKLHDDDPRPNSNSRHPHGTACGGIAAGNLGTVGDYIGGGAHNAKLYVLKISYGDSPQGQNTQSP